jgi:HAE1 family hydrophobic/amphiphilic exporter-1
MSSVSGRFLFQFGLTAAVAVLVSLLVSFTLTPMMSARLLGSRRAAGGGTGHAAAASRGGFYARIDRGYHTALRFSMRHRWIVAVLAIAVMLGSFPLYRMVPQEFTPASTDEANSKSASAARKARVSRQ